MSVWIGMKHPTFGIAIPYPSENATRIKLLFWFPETA